MEPIYPDHAPPPPILFKTYFTLFHTLKRRFCKVIKVFTLLTKVTYVSLVNANAPLITEINFLSYTVGTGSSPAVKLPGRGIDHPHLAPMLKEE